MDCSVVVVLVLCLSYSTLAQVKDSQCCFKVHNVTKQIIDAQGNSRLFHGVNIVVKGFPYYPDNSSFDPEFSLSSEDIEFLSNSGFNVVRLYVAWPGIEPKKDQYNDTYLDVIEDFVNKLGSKGIYSILDCHQDLWSPKFCGEGAPDYAALYENRSIKSLPFPELFPQLTPFHVNPNTGYPSRTDCRKHSFFTYYFSDAVGKAYQSLYDNEQSIQERFILYWERIAKRFAGNSYVLGYELLNEPWAGDLYRHLDEMKPTYSDKNNLQPMYSKLHAAIRQYDDQHIIFFEPTVVFTSLPFKAFSKTGFTEGPGGPDYNDRQIYSYHMYCIIMNKEGEPSSARLCDLYDKDIFSIRIDDQKTLAITGFLTEWGAYVDITPGSAAESDAIQLMELADNYLQPWTYWQYKGFGDFTTQSSTGEGLYYKNGSLQEHKVKLLTRTYARSVPGSYINMTFDYKTSNFVLYFKADVSVQDPTCDIYLNEGLYYPAGYTVSVVPSNAMNFTTSHNCVKLQLTNSVVNGQEINVNIIPKKASPSN